MAVDGVLKFNTKINTGGVDKGTEQISAKVLKLKNKIANTEAEARRLRQEMEELARTPLDTSKSSALKVKMEETKAAIREAGREYDALVTELERRSTDSKGVIDEKALSARMAQNTELKEKDALIQRLNTDLERYRSQLQSAQTAEAQTTGADTAEYARKQQRLDVLNGRLSEYQAQLRETRTREYESASGINTFSNGAAKASAILSKVRSGLTSCASALGRVAHAGLNAARNGLTRVGSALKNIISHSKSANRHLNILSKGMKKIQRWGLTLIGIRSLVTGVRMVVRSAMENNEKLNNSLTATKGVIGQMLTPAISFLVYGLQKIVSLADRVYQIFTGTSIIAKYNATQTAKMAKEQAKAAKNAKKQKDYLASFDQLNVMTKNNKDDSDSSSTDSVAYFKKLSTPFDKFVDKIANLFKTGKFENIGQLIADKINKGLKKIKWTKIRKTAKKIANNIASFINGFVKKLDWDLVGKTIGNGIMTAVDFAYELLTKINWKKIGSGIAKLLNGAIKAIDWKKVGKTLGKALSALVNLAYGFVKTFKWAKFGSSIHNAIKGAIDNINWKKAIEALTTGINGIITFALKTIGTPDFKKLGQNVAQGLTDTLNGINWEGIRTLFTTLISGAFKFVEGFSLSINWDKFGKTLSNSFNSFFKKGGQGYNTVSTMANSLSSIICGLLTSLDQITLSIDWSNFGKQVASDFNSFFGKNGKGSKILAATGKTIGDLCNSGLDFVISFFEDQKTADTLIKGVEKLLASIPWKKMLIKSLSAILNAASWLIKAAGDLIDDFCKGLATGFEDASTDPELIAALKELGKAIGNLLITLLEAALKIIVNAIPNFILGLLKCIVQLFINALGLLFGDEWKKNQEQMWNLWGKDSFYINYDIKLPRLATGTVVPANYGEYLAVLGDNKREPEVVSPLSTMKQAFIEAMSELGGYGGNQDTTVVLELDGDVLLKHVVKANDKDRKRRGKSLLA